MYRLRPGRRDLCQGWPLWGKTGSRQFQTGLPLSAESSHEQNGDEPHASGPKAEVRAIRA
jgi:hypothetical protein